MKYWFTQCLNLKDKNFYKRQRIIVTTLCKELVFICGNHFFPFELHLVGPYCKDKNILRVISLLTFYISDGGNCFVVCWIGGLVFRFPTRQGKNTCDLWQGGEQLEDITWLFTDAAELIEWVTKD